MLIIAAYDGTAHYWHVATQLPARIKTNETLIKAESQSSITSLNSELFDDIQEKIRSYMQNSIKGGFGFKELREQLLPEEMEQLYGEEELFKDEY